jgi:hypothetical protein
VESVMIDSHRPRLCNDSKDIWTLHLWNPSGNWLSLASIRPSANRGVILNLVSEALWKNIVIIIIIIITSRVFLVKKP